MAGSSTRLVPNIDTVPPEVLERIAFFVALEPHFGPPSHLPALVRSTKHLERHLSIKHNKRLYAQLFRSKFDTTAPERRYATGGAPLAASNLADEYVARVDTLRRIRRRVELGDIRPAEVDGENADGEGTGRVLEDLWRCWITLLEHDARNVPHLMQHLPDYIALYHAQVFLKAAIKPGYPPDNAERSLVMWLSWSLQGARADHTRADRDEKLFVLRPYVFAAHQFDAYHAPWPYPRLPVSLSHVPPPPTQPDPFLADLTPRPRAHTLTHFGNALRISPPILAHAAFLGFFARVRPDGAGVAVAEDDSESEADVESSEGQTVLGGGRSGRRTKKRVLKSREVDVEWTRLTRCLDPFEVGGGCGAMLFRGMFEGAWEGRFSFFEFDAYRDMLGGSIRSLYEGPFSEQPQVWRLTEKVVRARPSLANTSTLQAICGGDRPATAGPLDPGLLRKKESEEGEQEDEEEEDVEGLEGMPEGEKEIAITGTGHSAWGRFNLRGRVRAWDGMFMLCKEYTPDRRGRWLYRGYVLPGGVLVGRWRDTFTPVHMAGYEGTFMMVKR